MILTGPETLIKTICYYTLRCSLIETKRTYYLRNWGIYTIEMKCVFFSFLAQMRRMKQANRGWKYGLTCPSSFDCKRACWCRWSYFDQFANSIIVRFTPSRFELMDFKETQDCILTSIASDGKAIDEQMQATLFLSLSMWKFCLLGNVYRDSRQNFWERPDDAISTFWNTGLDWTGLDLKEKKNDHCCCLYIFNVGIWSN